MDVALVQRDDGGLPLPCPVGQHDRDRSQHLRAGAEHGGLHRHMARARERDPPQLRADRIDERGRAGAQLAADDDGRGVDRVAQRGDDAADLAAGVFADDRTQSGVTVESQATLTDSAVILPKLFRRLAEYLQLGDGDPSLAGFNDFLAQQADLVWIVPTGQKTGFDTVVAVDGQTVKLTRPPEELVFEEK